MDVLGRNGFKNLKLISIKQSCNVCSLEANLSLFLLESSVGDWETSLSEIAESKATEAD